MQQKMSAMKANEIIREIENFAPLSTQESYDNCGIQVGNPHTGVTGLMITLDVTEEVIDESISLGCNFILSHHPLIFRGIKKITGDDYIQNCLIKAIKNDILIYSAHTNVDKSHEGVSAILAKKIGLINGKILKEEGDGGFGLGYIGELATEEGAFEFLNRIKQELGVGCIRHSKFAPERKIKKVALCGGSGSEFISDAIANKVDIYLTGDIKYHQFFEVKNDLILADIGHFESEQYIKDVFFDIVSKINPKFAIHFTDYKTNPIKYI